MNTSEISHRYAKVLFHMASSQGLIENVLKSIEPLEILLQKPSEFLRLMVSPQVDDDVKMMFLKRSLGDGQSQEDNPQSKILEKFLLFLLKKGRIKFLPEILQEYQRLASEKLGVLNIRLISAAPVDAETNEKLVHKLEELFQQKTQIKQKIDPSLIGGGIFMIGNKMLDGSIKGKLLRLKKHLLRG